MTEQQKWDFINNLDDELLVGGVSLSEWTTFLIRDANVAFANGAHLAAILTALAGIECHLRHEYSSSRQERLVELIDLAPIDDVLKKELHSLRKYRNRWVHVVDPADDQELLNNPGDRELELEEMSMRAIRAMRKIAYIIQWI